MSLIDIILLAIALGIDCTIVSFSQGLCFKENRLQNALRLAFSMGIFQGIFPVIGFVGTDYIYDYIDEFGEWIVFGIFLILGLKFIFESFQNKKEKAVCIEMKNVIAFGIATSLDALVSGATLQLTQSSLIISCLIIGFTSFFMSIFGFFTGNMIKFLQPRYMQIFGGLILIFLAIKAIF